MFIAKPLLSCTEERPSGSVAEKTITTLNLVSKPPPKGNPSELFSMLSQNFISEFSEEIELAKSIDSIELRSLPMMKMLRILSLKNAYSKQLTTLDNKSIITNWIESSGKGFPLKSGSRYYYSEDLSTENKILAEGRTFPQVLLVNENGKIKINLFNTKTYQEKRIKEILKSHKLDEIIKDAAWLHTQTQRKLNWK